VVADSAPANTSLFLPSRLIDYPDSIPDVKFSLYVYELQGVRRVCERGKTSQINLMTDFLS